MNNKKSFFIFFICFFLISTTLEILSRSSSYSNIPLVSQNSHRGSINQFQEFLSIQDLSNQNNVRNSIENSHSRHSSRRSSDKYNSFNIKTVLRDNSFSTRIWQRIWINCDYKCFVRNNFKMLKYNLLREMNEYRKWHNAPKLTEDRHISKLAQKRANQIALTSSLTRDDSDYLGETVGVAYLPAAFLIAKKWYEEKKGFNFLLKRPKPGSQMFTQLVWKSSLIVGIGVAVRGDMVIVVCKYLPKGNTPKDYKRNVDKLHYNWFNSFTSWLRRTRQ
ncbi:CAP domain-containing protein [Strongyloides ratti]|uniref:CAP domain-containing protein n=1 Tax=Strongyloides ratti TaxID=34506 RepID=A0A090L8N0_STRRB|nr:CAP domain-containing protein [Strongyloides ratti]CEF66097.1 CAP domain-containing protein [Strongyloides ratti]